LKDESFEAVSPNGLLLAVVADSKDRIRVLSSVDLNEEASWDVRPHDCRKLEFATNDLLLTIGQQDIQGFRLGNPEEVVSVRRPERGFVFRLASHRSGWLAFASGGGQLCLAKIPDEILNPQARTRK